MRKIKQILGLIKQLDKLLEESEDIFFEERPFLFDRNLEPKIMFQDEKREENELKIKKIVEAVGTINEETKPLEERRQEAIFQ